MHSWRVLMLEFWQPELFAQYRTTEPWNSVHNSRLSDQMPHQSRCGFAPSSHATDQTTQVAIVGPVSVMGTSPDAPRRQQDAARDAIMLIELNRDTGWPPMTHPLTKLPVTSVQRSRTPQGTSTMSLPTSECRLFVNCTKRHLQSVPEHSDGRRDQSKVPATFQPPLFAFAVVGITETRTLHSGVIFAFIRLTPTKDS
jgi:hypothetical protein